MKLWKLTQTEKRGRDTFESIVVSAETEEDAKSMHPYHNWPLNSWQLGWRTWASSPANVTAEYLGEAREGMPVTWICESFIGS